MSPADMGDETKYAHDRTRRDQAGRLARRFASITALVMLLSFGAPLAAQDRHAAPADSPRARAKDSSSAAANREVIEALTEYISEYFDEKAARLYREYLEALNRLDGADGASQAAIKRVLGELETLGKDFDAVRRDNKGRLGNLVLLAAQRHESLRAAVVQRQLLFRQFQDFVAKNGDYLKGATAKQKEIETSLSHILDDIAKKMRTVKDAAETISKAGQSDELLADLERFRAAWTKRYDDAKERAAAKARELAAWRSDHAIPNEIATNATAEHARNKPIQERYDRDNRDALQRLKSFNEAPAKIGDLLARASAVDQAFTTFYSQNGGGWVERNTSRVRSGAALWSWKGAGKAPNETPWKAGAGPGWVIHEIPADLWRDHLEWERLIDESERVRKSRPSSAPNLPPPPKFDTRWTSQFDALKKSLDEGDARLSGELRDLGAAQEKVADETRTAIEAEEARIGAQIAELGDGEASAEVREQLRTTHRDLVARFGKNYPRVADLVSKFAADNDGAALVAALHALPITEQSEGTRGIEALLQQHAGVNRFTGALASFRTRIGDLDRQIETMTSAELSTNGDIGRLRAELTADRKRYDDAVKRLEKERPAPDDAKARDLKTLHDLRAALARDESVIHGGAVTGRDVTAETRARDEKAAQINTLLESLVRSGALTAADSLRIAGDVGITLLPTPPTPATRDWGKKSALPIQTSTEIKDAPKQQLLSDWHFVLKGSLPSGVSPSLFSRAMEKSLLHKVDYDNGTHGYRAVLRGRSYFIGPNGELVKEVDDADALFAEEFETPEDTPSGAQLRIVNHWLATRFTSLKDRSVEEQDAVALALALLHEADKLPEGAGKRELIEIAKGMGELVLRLSTVGRAIDLYEGLAGHDIHGQPMGKVSRVISLIGAMAGSRQLVDRTLKSLLARYAKARAVMRAEPALRETEAVIAEGTRRFRPIEEALEKYAIKTGDGRRNYAKVHTALESLPGGLKIQQIREGVKAGKVALIGRVMGDEATPGVNMVKNFLATEGHTAVETFKPSERARQLWKQQLEALPRGERLPLDRVIRTEIYAENIRWAQQKAAEGYMILDVGNPTATAEVSAFYEMEKRILFPEIK